MKQEEASHEDRLRELRDRLYSRGQSPKAYEQTPLKDVPVEEVPHTWQSETLVPYEFSAPTIPPPQAHPMPRRTRSYRTKLIIGGLVFFLVTLVLSGSFLLFGKNAVQGGNLSLALEAPFVVGGGEELQLQATITNKNAVPIQSATLIVEYPYGTQSVDEPGKELFRDRKVLNPLQPGETMNVPLYARVFGEENEEKTVLVSVEYRIEGSNATYVQDADPIRFKITSSPVVLSVENVEKMSSGQEAVLSVSVTSNASEELESLLLKAEYPQGFDFTSAQPAPVSGQDTWSIARLKPQEKRTITIRGVLVGEERDNKVFSFLTGLPSERDRFSLASVLSTAREEITIETPFLAIDVNVNGEGGEDVVIGPKGFAQITIGFHNTLSTTLYDGRITVDLSGNGFTKSDVRTEGGFYDSSQNMIIWDSSEESALQEISPGRTRSVSFSISPEHLDSLGRTPKISFVVNVEANRIGEGNVSERLVGTARRSIKIETIADLSSSVLYSVGAFTNTGPVPPTAEEVTTYTMHLYVKNGSNAITDGIVTMNIPLYVTWLSLATTPGDFVYNTQTREVQWKVGDLEAGAEREDEFQFSLKPSVSQIGQVLTLIGEQRFRATDRFTGTVVRDTAPAVTTQLAADPEYENQDGRVEK